MSVHKTGIDIGDNDRIHTDDEWEMCAWARYFNASEHRVNTRKLPGSVSG